MKTSMTKFNNAKPKKSAIKGCNRGCRTVLRLTFAELYEKNIQHFGD